MDALLPVFRRLIPVLFFITSVQTVRAKSINEFRVEHFGDDVLPQSTVLDICPDPKGFLWIGTGMGLLRFDGQHLKIYTPANTPAIKNIRCWEFITDRGGQVYYLDGSYKLYSLQSLEPQPLSYDSFLIVYKSIYRKKYAPDNASDARPEHGRDPYLTDVIYYGGVRKLTYAIGHDTIRYTLPVPTVLKFHPSFILDDRLWIINPDFTITALHPVAGIQGNLHFSGDILQNPLFGKSGGYNESTLFAQKRIFYKLGSTIYRISIAGNTLHTTAVLSDVHIKDIISFCEDSTNGYYAFGTLTQGLYILHPASFKTRRLKAGGLANYFYGVVPVKDNLFFSSRGYLFDLYKDYEKKIIKVSVPFGMFKNGDTIWLSNDTRFRKGNIRGLSFKNGPVNGEWLLKGVTDQWGRIWVLCTKGLYRYENGRLNGLLSLDQKDDGDNLFETFFVKDKQTLWLGQRNGLSIYKVDTRERKYLPETKGLYVRNLIGDDKGGVWILTYGNGYYYYNDRQFVKMPLDPDQYLSAVHTMLPDKNGYYWMPTNKGLFRVKKQALYNYLDHRSDKIRYEYFDKNCGFLTNEFNGGCSPCGYNVSDTLMLLPGTEGLVYFNPLAVTTPPLDNAIYIDKLLIDDKPYQYTNTIEIPSGFSSLRCEVSSPYYGIRENLVLEYKIEGVMKDWQPLIENRYIQSNRLPYGSYKIRIRKVTDLYTNKVQELAIVITVGPPWYLSKWFITLIGILLVAGVWLIIQLRLRILITQKKSWKRR